MVATCQRKMYQWKLIWFERAPKKMKIKTGTGNRESQYEIPITGAGTQNQQRAERTGELGIIFIPSYKRRHRLAFITLGHFLLFLVVHSSRGDAIR